MAKLKMILLGAGCSLVGIMMILVGVNSYKAGEYSLSSLIGMIVFGLLFIAGAGCIFFLSLTVSKEENADSTKEFIRKFKADYRDYLGDVTSLDKLLTSFKKEWSGFFAGKEFNANITQIFQHVELLQKKRLDSLGIGLGISCERQQYGDNSAVRANSIKGLQYIVTNVSEDIACDRVYTRKNSGDRLFTVKDRQIAHYTLIEAKKAGKGNIICPSCGSSCTRESLLDGCDYCHTKFTVNDLSRRVAGFSLRRDFNTQYSKYKGNVTRGSNLVVAVCAAAAFIISMGYYILHPEIIAGNEGLLVNLIAGLFASAFVSFAAGIISFVLVIPVFALLQALGITALAGFTVKDQSKKQAKRDRQMEDLVRRHDRLFDIGIFYNNVQNKLASVVYASGNNDANAFASSGTDLGHQAARFRNVIDMDIANISIDKYAVSGQHQTADVSIRLRTVEYSGSKAKASVRPVKIRLRKSAGCLTQEIFTPGVMRCDGCGSSVSFIEGKSCPYCRREIELEKYDWAITALG